MTKKYFPILLFILLFLLSGCGKKESSEISDATEPIEQYVKPIYEKASVSFTEPYGMVYDTTNGWKSEYNSNTYCFTNKLSEEDRDSVMLETDILIQIMAEMLHTKFEGYTLCMLEDSYFPRVEDKTLYIGYPNFKTQDFGIGICQMLLGNNVRFGLSYGLGRELSYKRGYSVETLEELSDALQLCDTTPEYLDLNYACFLEEYADTPTLVKIKSIASGFCAWIMENKKEHLFTDYSDKEYRSCLNSFLTLHGKQEYTSTDLDNIWFYNGGENIRLIWEDPNAVFFVMKDYVSLVNLSNFPDMVNTGYKNLRQLVIDYYQQSQFVDQILTKYEKNSNQKATVYFADHKKIFDMTYAGWYNSQENEIGIQNCTTFTHEYTHYLLRDTPINNWCNEMLAHYYGTYPINNHISYEIQSTKLWYENLDPNNPEDVKEIAFENAARSHLDHDFQYNSLEDLAHYSHAGTLLSNQINELMTARSYGVKYSFFIYLQNLYEEETVLDAIINNTPEELSNKTWDELVYEWKEWLFDEYSWATEFEY